MGCYIWREYGIDRSKGPVISVDETNYYLQFTSLLSKFATLIQNKNVNACRYEISNVVTKRLNGVLIHCYITSGCYNVP